MNLLKIPSDDKYKNIRKWIALSVKKLNAAIFGISAAGTTLSHIIIAKDIKKIFLYRVFMLNQTVTNGI